MGAGASLDTEAPRTYEQWLRLLGRGVLDVREAFQGLDDTELLSFTRVRELAAEPRELHRAYCPYPVQPHCYGRRRSHLSP